MICSKPFVRNGAEHGCGQCKPCRINRRRLWTARLILESFLHQRSWFVTLTYAPEHLPQDGSVSPRHLKLWLLKLRKAYGRPFRYFAVGEYGERGGRPHYHALIFGLEDPRLIATTWGKGHVHIGMVSDASAAYCTGYISKALTANHLGGRHKEFARMSLKPGIGAGAVPELARAVRAGADSFIHRHGDVPREVRIAGKKMDIGRYLVNKLRVAVGRSPGLPEDLIAVKQIAFWRRLQNAEELAKRAGKRRHDAARAYQLEANRRMKGLL